MVDAYCLDTVFLIDLLKHNLQAGEVAKEISGGYLCTTQLNVYELLVGFYATGSQDIGHLIEQARVLLDRLTILPLNDQALQRSAQVGGFLCRKGQKIEHMDCLIAGTLLEHGCTTIITRNVADFKRIPGLKVKTY